MKTLVPNFDQAQASLALSMCIVYLGSSEVIDAGIQPQTWLAAIAAIWGLLTISPMDKRIFEQ